MTKIAVEVGGTFTDLIWLDESGAVRTHKVPSTPGDASRGVISGLEEALEAGVSNISQLFHGSTVATNAVLERKGCRAALLTTRGFRDLLVLQRQLRPNVYAVACRKPEPLIPLGCVAEVTERIDANGALVTELDEAALIAAVDALVEAEKPEALAICLLHAYQNSVHEQRVRSLVQARYPDLPIVLSSEVLPTFREYERASTTAMAAYLVPLVGRYVSRLEGYLQERAGNASLFIMQSSGGVLPSGGARGVDMLNSGPAAGVIAAVRVSAQLQDRDIITLDVGGTSADVCLIADGRPDVTSETEIDGLPVGMPSVDIANVGAGGGSIGWIDSGGMLQVGPQSAGARPGPACYGHGGTAPAITDALVHLGWIRPGSFLGGRMTLLPERAGSALESLASKLGQTPAAAAQAMVDIGVAHVSRCVRLVSVQRGHDPKGYALYGYGGMGPMISALVAAELKIGRVVIPPHPGLFSALGLLVADLKRIYRITGFTPVVTETPAQIDDAFARMKRSATEEFATYGCRRAEIVWEHFLEMRFRGQGFELLVPIDPDLLKREQVSYLRKVFKEAHHARYGTMPPSDHIEIVTYRLVAEVPTARDFLDTLRQQPAGRSVPRVEPGSIVWQGRQIDCDFAWRDSLTVGQVLKGCTIVEEPTATTMVPPGWTATVHSTGSLVLENVEKAA
jgi:N-methylhydantoinase A